MSKTEDAYQALKQDILFTRLAPDAPLNLKKLCAQYGFGWTPMREALARLESEQLVLSRENRGFVVAPVSEAELHDLTNARQTVELAMLREAMEQGDEAWEEAIVTAHFRLGRFKVDAGHLTESDFDAWESLHDRFHRALLAACPSKTLHYFYDHVNAQLLRHRKYLAISPAIRAAQTGGAERDAVVARLAEALSLEGHTVIMEAVIDRDKKRAEHLLGAHIQLTRQVFTTALGEAVR
ncbi:GntR family transcriptional regulator [Neptunicoccus cionae]|uniref:GntR family transcriptional regulator n=1 Tax=Neptunicoccus cionae TaxID=2035344 RepID=UPI000C781C75|nr:GntR family transcriptional regulator [Amylibacter cionae]PLS21557.1 GntR family transcriptional regulator [Amylibacter cionae]